MNLTVSVTSMILLLLSQQPVAAAEDATAVPLAATAATPPSDEQLHEGLRELKAAMEQALNARDLEAILARVDAQVVFTTMNGDVVTGRDGVRAYFERMLNGPNKVVKSVRVSFVPEALSILHGGDTAISWGSTDDHYELAAGQSFAIQARWSGTMIRREGRWLVANFHYSTNMFDNPVLQTQRRFLLLGGAVAGLVLAAIGFALGRRSGRRAA
jgi:uncharacterized protein (TIGR02246 family)